MRGMVHRRTGLTVSTKKTVNTALLAPSIKQEDRRASSPKMCGARSVSNFIVFFKLRIFSYTEWHILGDGFKSKHEIHLFHKHCVHITLEIMLYNLKLVMCRKQSFKMWGFPLHFMF